MISIVLFSFVAFSALSAASPPVTKSLRAAAPPKVASFCEASSIASTAPRQPELRVSLRNRLVLSCLPLSLLLWLEQVSREIPVRRVGDGKSGQFSRPPPDAVAALGSRKFRFHCRVTMTYIIVEIEEIGSEPALISSKRGWPVLVEARTA